ncbi:mucin-2-like isoform X2 [Tachysurus vachellii]|uniref:mucin-2-like isoform X2 n=1 Tax=Tachysurus vachellii TaxID=175792 RepID=UPI00296B1E5A|nr:mucin-2-like isoform X2 [Tachysurus vachellii]
MELLVLLIFFHLILDINSQYRPQPQLSVSPEVITLRGSVQLHCHVPDHLKVYQCFFYPETQNTNIKLSPSCQLSVTGSELIRWTGHRSPEALRIICYYTVDKSVHVPSPHSLPAPVTVMYQKPRLSVGYDDQTDDIIFSCEIPESESVAADVSCNLYTGENPQPYLKILSNEKKPSKKLVCIFTAQRNDVFNVLQSVKSSEVSCDYSLISDSTARSLMSDKYNLIPFFPTPTQTSTTETSTAGLFSTLTQTSTTETSTGLFPAPTQTSTTETFTTVSTTDLITTKHITTHLHPVPTTPSTPTETSTARSSENLQVSSLWTIGAVCVLVSGALLTGFSIFIFLRTDRRGRPW